MVYRVLFWCSLFFAGLVTAGEPHYESDIHDTTWVNSASPIRCTLSHEIPYYGRVEFVRDAGLPLSFRVYVHERPINSGRAMLYSSPPQWKHDSSPRELGSVEYKAGSNPFRFKRELSLRVLAELEKGMQPMLTFRDLGDGADQISVTVSNVNFLPALEKYRQCNSQLVHYSFASARDMSIHFATGDFQLTSDAKRRLDSVAAYMKLDSSITGVMIEGHTDYVGSHMDNDILSNQRASAVRDYLLTKEIPQKENITLRYYGKRKPAASNKSARGRAQNRRTQVKLVFQ